jgi:hypothetical protein
MKKSFKESLTKSRLRENKIWRIAQKISFNYRTPIPRKRGNFAILVDDNKAQKAKQELLTKQTAELYLQIGLADVLGKKFQAALGGAFGGDGTAGRFRTDLNLMPGLTGGELGTHYEELQTQFQALISTSNQVKFAAESIGTAFGNTFTGLITGSMGAREAFAGFFQSIANHFADMASRMIADYIRMQIIGLAQQFLPAIGGIFGAGGRNKLFKCFWWRRPWIKSIHARRSVPGWQQGRRRSHCWQWSLFGWRTWP